MMLLREYIAFILILLVHLFICTSLEEDVFRRYRDGSQHTASRHTEGTAEPMDLFRKWPIDSVPKPMKPLVSLASGAPVPILTAVSAQLSNETAPLASGPTSYPSPAVLPRDSSQPTYEPTTAMTFVVQYFYGDDSTCGTGPLTISLHVVDVCVVVYPAHSEMVIIGVNSFIEIITMTYLSLDCSGTPSESYKSVPRTCGHVASTTDDSFHSYYMTSSTGPAPPPVNSMTTLSYYDTPVACLTARPQGLVTATAFAGSCSNDGVLYSCDYNSANSDLTTTRYQYANCTGLILIQNL